MATHAACTHYTDIPLRILTGILNTIGGAYCLKAKAVIQAQPITSATDMAVPVPGQVTAPM